MLSNKKPYKVTIRSKLLLSLLLASLAMVVYTAVYSYHLATDRVKDISMRLSERTTLSAGKALENNLSALYEQTNDFIKLDAITKAASSDHVSDFYEPIISSAAALQVQDTSVTSLSYDFIGIYFSNGYSFQTHTQDPLPFSTYDQCVSHLSEIGSLDPTEHYISGQWTLCTSNHNGKAVLSFYRFIYEELTMKKLGIVVFGINERSLQEYLSVSTPNCFLMATDGTLLSSTKKYNAGQRHPDSEYLTKHLRNNNSSVSTLTYQDSSDEERIISSYPLWRMRAYLIIPFEFYESVREEEMADYLGSMLPMASIAVLMAIGLAYIFSHGLSRSIMSLVSFTKKVDQVDSTLRFCPSTNDEIAELGSRINHMLDQIQLSAHQREEDLIAKQLLELQLIQQQINPHLLYNTLDSVLWVLQQNRIDDAHSLIGALSEFFKISLSRGRDIISLAEEIALIKHYLTIQHLARQQNVCLECEIPEYLLQHPIIKLTIQPIIENAIIHGFSGYRNDGKLNISAWHDDSTTYIQIVDNGIGMTEDELANINNALQQPTRPAEFNHFGLFNINQRIRQTYGSGFGLSVESELSEYTKITLTLPYLPTE